MDGPVVTIGLAELAGAIQRVDDPHPITGEAGSIIDRVLHQHGISGTQLGQCRQDQRCRSSITLFPANARLCPRQLLPQGDEELAGPSGQVAGQRLVRENGR